MTSGKKERKIKFLLVGLSVFVAFGIGEIALRIIFPFPQQYCVWRPNINMVFHPESSIMPGIYNESRFMTNSMGVRGDEFPENDFYKILTIGGSTTECFYLDQEESWPQLLQRNLNEHSRKPVWVGNCGKSGLNTNHHLTELTHLLPQLPYKDLNIVIMLVGINDLSYFLSNPDNYLDVDEEYLKAKAFNVIPERDKPLFKRSRYWYFAENLNKVVSYAKGVVLDDEGNVYSRLREHRQDASRIIDSLPDLTRGLAHYAENLDKLIDVAKEKGFRIIFVTQPILWTAEMHEGLKSLLWMGGIGNFQEESGKAYYSTRALAEAMELFNEELRKTCAKRDVDIVDLAAVVPSDTSAFYDDCHFNENGALMTANYISKKIHEGDLLQGPSH